MLNANPQKKKQPKLTKKMHIHTYFKTTKEGSQAWAR